MKREEARTAANAETAAIKFRQFIFGFLYYFCTSTDGFDRAIEDSEQPMEEAWNAMFEMVKGNKALRVRLEGFVPRWEERARFEPTVIIPPLLMMEMEEDFLKLLD